MQNILVDEELVKQFILFNGAKRLNVIRHEIDEQYKNTLYLLITKLVNIEQALRLAGKIKPRQQEQTEQKNNNSIEKVMQAMKIVEEQKIQNE